VPSSNHGLCCTVDSEKCGSEEHTGQVGASSDDESLDRVCQKRVQENINSLHSDGVEASVGEFHSVLETGDCFGELVALGVEERYNATVNRKT
jgi:hypothetical protein